MIVKKIGLSSITVADAKKSLQFFTETLGLRVVESSPEYNWYEFAGKEDGVALGMGQCYGEAKAGMNAIVSLVVDDIENVISELKSKNVRFLGDIMEVPGGMKLILFCDLDGNLFYLVQEPK